ncbi:MAG TPA: TIGR03016 family PEP-CTERM system-associated outer membrane protein [Noviherbaspirillum sp.]|jgi:uncharacterized protein (PEP-CTERM system associated)|uniref:TIGR03016 family PEP-CTERM system-associated outer membrane protein n=1 Tax=Noviherbaspirillum sp. TaxID=1926288 RepID=UPI002DDD87FE|nr:TIGR03016 family PEP-CTERM system-associated outer membrane protein [Noviherbaspirillum sp.]HEV2612178.1 TIGR03016 family PEP-CTERM system-associated outer membrane protein [Noviherbaspirillum sp.]
MAITIVKSGSRHERRARRKARVHGLTIAAPVVSITSAFGVASIAALSFSSPALAAEWRIVPNLELRQTYTDNVRLSPAGAERSDAITDISPGISITGSGPGLKFTGRYAFQYLRYARDAKDDSSFHKLDATTNVEFIKNLFAFDGTASIGQQNLSLLGPQATDNYLVTGNRTTVRTVSASPYLHHHFRGLASAELRYTHTGVDTSSDALSSSSTDGLRLTVSSDPAFRNLAWGFSHDHQKIRPADASPVDLSVTTASLRYMVMPQLHLTGALGYDKYDYVAAASAAAPEGTFYTAGFSWRPTERTSLAFSAGERFYGKTYSLNSSIRSRASLWRLSYDESVTTSTSEFTLAATTSTAEFLNQLFRPSIPDDALRQQAVDRFILNTGLQPTLSRSVNYLSNQFFLQKALRASVAITGARNTLLFTAYNLDRRPQSAGGAAILFPGTVTGGIGETRQTGLNALWNWRIGTRTNATFTADFSKSKLNVTGTEDRLRTYRIAFAHRIQPKLDGVIEIKRAEQDSDTFANNYHENAISAFLSMKF